jgi:Polyketide cyclase / dehydrase and lipid transport
MRSVSVSRTFPGTVHEAETCWYDTTQWPAWVDGLDRVADVTEDWPAAGASVRWESGPAGRGRVRELVVVQERLAGQTLEVEDDSIRGRQSVAFTPVDGDVEIVLRLEYEIERGSIFTPIVDLLFIRRAMAASLGTTLTRFGAELAAVQAEGH